MKISEEDFTGLNPSPDKYQTGMPSLEEIDYAISLIMKRYPVDAWYLRRRLKWLVRKVDKHYDIQWTTPWKGRKYQH